LPGAKSPVILRSAGNFCHSEERSDEESDSKVPKTRSFALLRTTPSPRPTPCSSVILRSAATIASPEGEDLVLILRAVNTDPSCVQDDRTRFFAFAHDDTPKN